MKIIKSTLFSLVVILFSLQNATAQKTTTFADISLEVPDEWEFNENMPSMGNGGRLNIHFTDYGAAADSESPGYAASMYVDGYHEIWVEGPFEEIKAGDVIIQYATGEDARGNPATAVGVQINDRIYCMLMGGDSEVIMKTIKSIKAK